MLQYALFRILFEREKAHNASVQQNETNKHEQCPKQILCTVHALMGEIESNIVTAMADRLKCIAVSGQMHGVVLWNGAKLRYDGVWHFKNIM